MVLEVWVVVRFGCSHRVDGFGLRLLGKHACLCIVTRWKVNRLEPCVMLISGRLASVLLVTYFNFSCMAGAGVIYNHREIIYGLLKLGG